MPTKTEKESKLSASEEKKLNAKIELAKLDILEKREVNSNIQEYYETEGKKRYRCIVTSTRRGEKTFELMVENPSNIEKPVRLNGKLGVEIKDGLPMVAIQRLENAFDIVSEDIPANNDPNVFSQTTFKTSGVPRYNVKILGEVESPKPLGSKISRK
jgi:hypothetical protein